MPAPAITTLVDVRDMYGLPITVTKGGQPELAIKLGRIDAVFDLADTRDVTALSDLWAALGTVLSGVDRDVLRQALAAIDERTETAYAQLLDRLDRITEGM